MAYINHDVPTMAMPKGMNRMGQFPLDMSSVFYTEAELKNYAETSAIAYVGQTSAAAFNEYGLANLGLSAVFCF